MTDRSASPNTGALCGVRVLDLTTLLPGPLATLLLAEAGATVLKIEPPGGDPLRHQGPHDVHGHSVPFQLLNRGKRLKTLDLKTTEGRDRLIDLGRTADILVEQFRPGVMHRFGLGPDVLAAVNPRLIYCSITGYGQSGPDAQRAGHDLNYVAEAGLLANSAGGGGAPVLPSALVADIGGGSWPAVMNILLALLARGTDGRGRRLDIAMANNLWPFQIMPLARCWTGGAASAAGSGPLTGGLPRYNLYETRDGRWLALGALEDRFLARFLAIAGLGDAASRHHDVSREEIASRIREDTAATWLQRCGNEDVCVSLVRDLRESIAASTLDSIRAFVGSMEDRRTGPPSLPLPIDTSLRAERPDSLLASDDVVGWAPD